MAQVTAQWKFNALDLGGSARIWTQDSAGTQRRMINRGESLRAVIESANHLLGRQMRPLAMMAQTTATVEGVGSAPLYDWNYDDHVVNARDRTMRVLALPPTAAKQDNCYIATSTGVQSGWLSNSATGAYPQDLTYHELPYSRGAASNTNGVTETINTYDAYRAMDVVVQDDALVKLDSDDGHDLTDWRATFAGSPVVSGTMEQLRACHARHRDASRPLIISWMAHGASNAYQNPTIPNANGIAITNTSWVNVLDTSITERTANTPGATCPARYAGKGLSNSVATVVSVLAKVAAGESSVSLVGAIDNGTATITSTSPTWHRFAGPTLQSNVQDNFITIQRNKLDFMAKTDGNALRIYSILAWSLP